MHLTTNDKGISIAITSISQNSSPHRSLLGSGVRQLNSCIGLRFEKLEASADLNDLVTLHRAILDLHPPNHKEHVKSVDELLFYFRKRGEKLGMIADLDECITRGRVALGLIIHPTGF